MGCWNGSIVGCFQQVAVGVVPRNVFVTVFYTLTRHLLAQRVMMMMMMLMKQMLCRHGLRCHASQVSRKLH